MKQVFPLENIETTRFLNHPVNTQDLGSIGKGLFTHIKRVKIDDLAPRQTHISGGTLNRKMSGKDLTTPYVVITDKGNILIDGHHTVIAKKLKGQKYILAQCYTLTSINN